MKAASDGKLYIRKTPIEVEQAAANRSPSTSITEQHTAALYP